MRLFFYNEDMKEITSSIHYIERSFNPLSSDIAIIDDGGIKWLFDVGNNIDSIKELNGEYNVVISHFHIDHIGSINNINAKKIYLSKQSYKHINRGIIVDKDIHIGGIHIFPLPSSHAKGSLGLEVDEEYVFVGDSLYGKEKDDKVSYNVQLLKEQIEVLKNLKATKIIESHNMDKVLSKQDVLIRLEDIYSQRNKNNTEILVANSHRLTDDAKSY